MRKRIVLITISIILIIALSLAFVSSVYNGHFHRIGNGKVIYFHTHPHEKGEQGNPFPNHKHTKFQFFILDILTHLFEHISVLQFIWLFTLSVFWLNFSPVIKSLKYDITLDKLIRAPPRKSFEHVLKIHFHDR